MHRSTRFTLLAVGLLASASTTTARAQGQIQIRVTNLAPSNGTALTPVWLGIHSGSFSTFAPGQSASIALERLAEDGNTSPLMAAFSAAGFTTQTTLLGPGGAFLPSESSVATFMLNPANAQTRYLSYASMLLPSNDAFIGNASGTAIDLTDGMGHLRSFSFFVLGSQVWDAGTEVNDELASSTAFFGQSTPNTARSGCTVDLLRADAFLLRRNSQTPTSCNRAFRLPALM